MIIQLIFTCIVAWLVYYIYKIVVYNRKIEKIPGPKPHWLFGNVLDLSSDPAKLFIQIRQLAKEYPDGYRLWGGQNGTVNLITAEDIEVILSSMKHIDKGDIYNIIHPWLQTGLLTSTGVKWQQRRKILTPAFHFNILRRFLVIMNEHCQNLVSEIKNKGLLAKTNVLPLISSHTLNVICETAMGTTLDPTDEKQQKYRESIYGLAPLLIERAIRPWLYYDFIYNRSSLGKKQNSFLKQLHRFTREVIRNREENFKISDVENLENEPVTDGDLYSLTKRKKRLAMLDLLISAKNKGEFIDDEGIEEEVDTFMFEGHDTVSMGLSFALMLIANHKDIQEKIVEELDSIFGDSNRSATLEDLQNMKYLEMCIKESLRLYPSVPFISRDINEDTDLKNFHIPAGTMVHIHIFDVHRNPKVYENPDVFDPERFTPENTSKRHPYSYVPFSAGPRNCIGQRFAFNEMKCIISTILREFILEPITTPKDVILIIDIVLRTKSEINVRLVPRKNNNNNIETK